MERPLALHPSALSEPEYRAYTSILNEIEPSAAADWETGIVPWGEAKGWIRGKYGVDAASLDQILRLFPPTVVQGGSIKAPQLLAILRLISHVHSGRDVDRSLVFEQAPRPLGSDILSPSKQPAPSLPTRSSPPYPLPPPVRQAAPEGPSSGGRRVSSDDAISPPPPTLGSNPFRRSLSQASHYAARQSTTREDSASEDGGRRSPARTAPISVSMPKLHRAPSATGSSATLGGNARKKTGTTPEELPFNRNPFFSRPDTLPVNAAPPLPPLPPRKPTLSNKDLTSPVLPPPRHPPPPPPPKPTRKPSHTHSPSTSTLIRQSLMAAKTAQKVPESTLQQMKTLMIVKSSAAPSSSSTPNTGSLKERAAKEQQRSDSSSVTNTTTYTYTSPPSSTASSMEYVATARPPPLPKPLIRSTTTTGTRSPSPTKHSSPTKLSVEEVDTFVQRSESSEGLTRPSRSRSMHDASTSSSSTSASSPRPPVPTPPPRRKRPESVQVTTTSSPFISSAPVSSASASPYPSTLSRRSSVQHPPRQTSPPLPPSMMQGPFSSFYSTISNTTEHLQKLASKAEGGLAPGRGYISHRGTEGKRLVDADEEDEEGGYHRLNSLYLEEDSAPTVDDGSPGMDVTPEDRSWQQGRRPGLPSRSPTVTQSSQVQKELEQLRAGRMGSDRDGWGR